MRAAGAGARGCVGPLHGSRSWSLNDTTTSTARGQAGCPFPGSVIWLGTSHQGDPQTGLSPPCRARRGFSTSSVLQGSRCLMKLGANGDI